MIPEICRRTLPSKAKQPIFSHPIQACDFRGKVDNVRLNISDSTFSRPRDTRNSSEAPTTEPPLNDLIEELDAFLLKLEGDGDGDDEDEDDAGGPAVEQEDEDEDEDDEINLDRARRRRVRVAAVVLHTHK